MPMRAGGAGLRMSLAVHGLETSRCRLHPARHAQAVSTQSSRLPHSKKELAHIFTRNIAAICPQPLLPKMQSGPNQPSCAAAGAAMEAAAARCNSSRSHTLCYSSTSLHVDRTFASSPTCHLGLVYPSTRQLTVVQAHMAAFRIPQVARSANSKLSSYRRGIGRCLRNGLRPIQNEYSDGTRPLAPHKLNIHSISLRTSPLHVRHQAFNVLRSSPITSQVTTDSQVATPGEEKTSPETEPNLQPKPAATEEPKRVTAYPFPELEAKWQAYWEEHQTFRTPEDVDTSKPKFYVLDMFPYPRSACPTSPPQIPETTKFRV